MYEQIFVDYLQATCFLGPRISIFLLHRSYTVSTSRVRRITPSTCLVLSFSGVSTWDEEIDSGRARQLEMDPNGWQHGMGLSEVMVPKKHSSH